MSPIRLVTFDVTNTMIRVLGSVGQNYANVAAQYGKTVDPTKIDSAFKRQFKLQMVQHPNFGIKSGITPFKWWTSLVVECFKDAGYEDPSLTRIANHLYVHFATAEGWEVIPGTASVLDHLKEKGYKLGVVSNFDNRLDKILHELSLAHYFDFIIDSVSFGEAKPSHEIFDHALKAGKTEANDALHVGDNVTNDYHGAINAGLKALLLVNSDKTIPDKVNKDHVIQSLAGVESYLNDVS